MRFPRRLILLLGAISFVCCEKEDEVDISSAFMEVANTFFSGESPGASKFMDSDKKNNQGPAITAGILNNLGKLLTGNQGKSSGEQGGLDLSMLGPVLQMVASSASNYQQRENEVDSESAPGFNLESMLSLAGTFMGSNGNANLEGLMGLLPMFLEGFNSGDSGRDHGRKHDHSDHSWYMPPVLENLHVMWDHFRSSELGQTLWKNSGLESIIGSMTDADGRIKYQQILESLENPTARRRWIKTVTNFISEWISHISDPNIQQRYLMTAQFVGNSFLKSQGFPKSALFDPSRPTESLTKMINAGAKRYLNSNMDSAKYVKPAVAYLQDLVKLASEKGFIMSRVNAVELSSRLSNTVNNDIISPILKTYRAYKWAIKSPKCAAHIVCVINQKSPDETGENVLRNSLIKIGSFPAAWAISTKTGIGFWTLYGAIQERECFNKYPVDCTDFHEEEIRVTTEATHNEL